MIDSQCCFYIIFKVLLLGVVSSSLQNDVLIFLVLVMKKQALVERLAKRKKNVQKKLPGTDTLVPWLLHQDELKLELLLSNKLKLFTNLKDSCNS